MHQKNLLQDIVVDLLLVLCIWIMYQLLSIMYSNFDLVILVFLAHFLLPKILNLPSTFLRCVFLKPGTIWENSPTHCQLKSIT